MTSADQHRSLTPQYWARFTKGQQVLMIANEMHRASDSLAPESFERLRGCYARVLALADLTAAVSGPRTFKRELLRLRELIAARYVAAGPDPTAHAELLHAVLTLTPESYAQVRHLTGLPDWARRASR